MALKINRKQYLKPVALAAIILITGGLTYYFVVYKPNHSPNRVVTAGTAVATPRGAVSKPVAKNLNSTSSGSLNSGGATDTHGTSSTSTNSSQWTTSASGVITVKSPAPNSTLRSGDIVSGSSSASEVSYRLSDNKVGVIAQGTLTVTGDNFSGILNFQPRGTGGRLDVFTTNSMGVEYNEVQINVAF